MRVGDVLPAHSPGSFLPRETRIRPEHRPAPLGSSVTTFVCAVSYHITVAESSRAPTLRPFVPFAVCWRSCINFE